MKLSKISVVIIIAALLAAGALIWYWGEKNFEIFETNNQAQTGTLEGKVNVGPICPVERIDQPCPVPPAAYTSREVIIFKSDGKTVASRQHFDEQGNYRFILPEGNYIVDIPYQGGLGSSKDLPFKVQIQANQTTKFDFSIDTGIR